VARVFISYRHAEPDRGIASQIADALRDHEVFIDSRISPGGDWGELIEKHLGTADVLIAVTSEASAASDLVVEEIRRAHESYVANRRPVVIPVRLGSKAFVPYPLSAYLSRFQHIEWNGPADTDSIIARVRAAIGPHRATAHPASQRRRMIERVRSDWIHGVLENSLYHLARIDLGIHTAPDAVESALDVVIQRPGKLPEPLPQGTPLLPVLDDHLGQLLVLGAPGAGKTTLLLELARDLLVRAESDEACRIPVVFNLSSWALRRQALTDWLIDELRLRSDVPAKLAREWVANDQVLPLLDGLDEVASAHRDACVAAINAWRDSHGWSEIVVCSRIAEFEALSATLRLPAALKVQPLGRAEVEQYLELAGPPLAGVRASLHVDPSLWELLDTPLMLSVIAMALKGSPESGVDLGAGAPEQRRKRLYARYVDAMFLRRGKETRFTPDEFRCWLGWLANGMTRRRQTMFQIADLQPAWIESQPVRALVSVVVVLAAALLTGALAFVPLYVSEILHGKGLSLEWLLYTQGDDFVPPMAPFLCLLGGALAVTRGRSGRAVDVLEWRWPGFKDVAASTLKWAVAGIALCGVLGGAGCSAAMWSTRDQFGDTQIWSHASDFWEGAQTWSLIAAVPFGLGGAISAALHARVAVTPSAPLAAVARSLHSALFCLAVTIVLGIAFSFFVGDVGAEWLSTLLKSSRMIGVVGIFIALEKGGYFLLNHYAARAALLCERVIPWSLVPFLDAATGRVFLRKVGGGYIFVHRTLLEYFAALPRGQAATRASAAGSSR
jgi:DNA polymerase III delta prime subunit